MNVFKNDIYPFTIWIDINEDRNNTLSLFKNYYTKKPIEDVPMTDFVEPVVEISTGAWGVLMIFTNESRLCHKTVTHETVHALHYLLDQMGDKINGKETSAYIGGYIADCCIKSIKE